MSCLLPTEPFAAISHSLCSHIKAHITEVKKLTIISGSQPQTYTFADTVKVELGYW